VRHVIASWEKTVMKPFSPIVPEAQKPVYKRFKFAPAVEMGDLILVSGQIGFGPDMRLPEAFADQLENAFRNMEMILKEAGASLSDVVSLNSYHVGDLEAHMPAFVEVQSRLLGEPHPAWTAVGVTQLAVKGAHVEVSAIASRKRT
jgi:enamine deaminase RidA (YjgF/YER057c/UK114 family)